ncbi:OSJNBa0042D13.18 protein, related [Eimeria mitis]|uniref:OSJNBa0042D13.18 protein, related n=1 Tax=Eimeria mitis TaxID=44415 RepID=U6KGH8_9EIME|nr:OSJNBa0042D13.18 protein, related [Eimeria mitis]CDJ34573.1 OSJNBa0042D13.18 protein, related [Eimeria mitis]
MCRMCIAFKPLNELTVKQKPSMPRIDEILERLPGSAFDFPEAFLQIPVHPEDKQETAFHTCTSKLEYTCMPFGLVNAHAELQLRSNHGFLAPITHRRVVIYMHDVLVFSRNVQDQLQQLLQSLQLVREKQWLAKAQKCSLFMQKISFLGYRVSAAGVEPDQAKIEAIGIWPLPLYTRTKVQKFLGLASYYRSFVPGFARIAAPLTDLVKKGKQFTRTENEEEAALGLI